MEGSTSLSPLSSPSDITQAWLEELLKKKLGSSVKINTWSMKTPEVRSGYLSEICFLKTCFLTCGEGNEESEEERSLFGKFIPEDETMSEAVKSNCLGEREVEFYKHSSSEEFKVFCENSGLCHPVPEVYYAELRDNKLSLVLQDLNSDGYKTCVPPEGNSLQQIKSTIAAVAVIHGSGMMTIRNHGKHPLDIPFSCSGFVDFLVEGIKFQMKIVEGTPSKETLKSLLPFSKEILALQEKHQCVDTLIHGDLWTGNIMFSEGDQDVCIFDWQFARIGNPACDIVSLLLLSGAPHTYTVHLTEVLECYWESLEQALKKNGVPVDFTFQDLVRNVESMWMYGFMCFTLSVPAIMGAQINEDRVKAVIDFLEKREVFRKFQS